MEEIFILRNYLYSIFIEIDNFKQNSSYEISPKIDILYPAT